MIADLLTGARTIAVVGASANPNRPSNGVAAYLRRHGFTVYAVNPTLTTLFGEPVYPTLAEVPEPIDIVDVFRRSDAAYEVTEQAIEAGAKAIWYQLGVIDAKAAQLAAEAGLTVVMDRCTAVEHVKWRRSQSR